MLIIKELSLRNKKIISVIGKLKYSLKFVFLRAFLLKRKLCEQFINLACKANHISLVSH